MDSELPNRCPAPDAEKVQLTKEGVDSRYFRCESCGEEWTEEFDR